MSDLIFRLPPGTRVDRACETFDAVAIPLGELMDGTFTRENDPLGRIVYVFQPNAPVVVPFRHSDHSPQSPLTA